jgi:RNA polymerase sigma-70 factor, ECF subfamily
VHEPDAGVVRAAAAGDARAFERLVRECQVPIRRYLRHLVGDAALADDLTQDVLVKVHAQLHTYRFESRFMTWMFRVARNTALDHRRADMRRRKREERVALLLVEICGFSYAEVADLLGVPEGTAKSRVHRAREGVAQWFSQPRTRRR